MSAASVFFMRGYALADLNAMLLMGQELLNAVYKMKGILPRSSDGLVRDGAALDAARDVGGHEAPVPVILPVILYHGNYKVSYPQIVGPSGWAGEK